MFSLYLYFMNENKERKPAAIGLHSFRRVEVNNKNLKEEATMARGSLRKRSKVSWSIILDLGYERDSVTGKRRRRQKWMTVRGTKRQAEKKLAELLHKVNRNEFIEPSKITVGEWLDYWLEHRIKPRRRIGTYEAYEGILRSHLKPTIGLVRLQELSFTHLEAYYKEKAADLCESTLECHHSVISGALTWAQNKLLLNRNVAKLVDDKPTAREGNEEVKTQCWNSVEVRAFLREAKAFGQQPAAFYALTLDTGCRKGEICGLRWPNTDLETRKIRIVEQLLKPGPKPLFGPPKNGRARTIHLGSETVRLLKQHKQHQAELKLRNRQHYSDHGLVFAKEWEHLFRGRYTLGDPLQMNNLGQREFKKITEAAKVRTIKFHGMRHTCATLMLQAGVPVKVVSERLGHKRVQITMDVYQHVLPDMQEDAAAALNAVLFG